MKWCLAGRQGAARCFRVSGRSPVAAGGAGDVGGSSAARAAARLLTNRQARSPLVAHPIPLLPPYPDRSIAHRQRAAHTEPRAHKGTPRLSHHGCAPAAKGARARAAARGPGGARGLRARGGGDRGRAGALGKSARARSSLSLPLPPPFANHPPANLPPFLSQSPAFIAHPQVQALAHVEGVTVTKNLFLRVSRRSLPPPPPCVDASPPLSHPSLPKKPPPSHRTRSGGTSS